MIKLNVNVTRRVINEGHAGCADSCPVSLAVANALHKRFRRYNEVYVSTYIGCIKLRAHTDKGKEIRVTMTDVPKKVKDFIRTFDSVTPNDAQPFTFVFKGL